MASMAAIIARIAEKTLFVKPPRQVLESLTKESDFIDMNWRSFPNVGHRIMISSFHETEKIGGRLASFQFQYVTI
jgi:hypothetical protein